MDTAFLRIFVITAPTRSESLTKMRNELPCGTE
jgi:hypothetical protein